MDSALLVSEANHYYKAGKFDKAARQIDLSDISGPVSRHPVFVPLTRKIRLALNWPAEATLCKKSPRSKAATAR